MNLKLGCLFALCMTAAVADAQTGGGNTNQVWTDADVNRLAALAPAARRAELKAMDPSLRRGLWFAVLAKVRADRGVEGPAQGSYRSAVAAASPSHPKSAAGNAVNGTPVSGIIQYDSGPFTVSFGGGAIVGNRFNSAVGKPFQNGAVTAVQAVVIPGPAFTTSSAGFVLLGPQTGGGGANALFSSFTTAAGATDTVDFNGIAEAFTGSYFVLFGDFANSYVPVFGTGTTQAQGRHGIVGYTGGMGPNITGTFDFGGSLNAFVRSSANIVPVELLP